MAKAAKRALIGRALCGCPVACDMDNDPESRLRYVEYGYLVEVIDWADVPEVLKGWKWPCEHEQRRLAAAEEVRRELDKDLPNLLDARGRGKKRGRE